MDIVPPVKGLSILSKLEVLVVLVDVDVSVESNDVDICVVLLFLGGGRREGSW